MLKEIIHQDDIVKKLKKLGYKYISPSDLRNRRNNRDVILNDSFEKSLKKINKNIDDNHINKLKRELLKYIPGELSSLNKNITENFIQLYDTKSVVVSGRKQSEYINLVDYENIENNLFEFSTEVTFINDKDVLSRFDIVIFVNGMPMIIIEVESIEKRLEGSKQLLEYQVKAEKFFLFSQILIDTTQLFSRYLTTNTPVDFASKFDSNGSNEKMYEFLKKEVFLKILKNYIFFDKSQDGKKGSKKIARYQQINAVEKTIKSLKNKKFKGGIIWHTQGSGKSLTMTLLAQRILKTIPGAKIIVLTDRKQLNDQITDTFKSRENYNIIKAKSSEETINHIDNGDYTILSTMIHKFKDEVIRVVKDSNIFVFIDEAHRTQSSTLHSKMRNKLPNAKYIGFTGTPLIWEDSKKSVDVFGEYIDKYTIEEATKDGVIVPLTYDYRKTNAVINNQDAFDEEANKILSIVDSESKNRLIEKNSKLSRVLETKNVVETIANDIISDFNKNYKKHNFSALIATSSRYAASKYYDYITKKDKNLRIGFLISKADPDSIRNEKITLKNSNEIHEKREEFIESTYEKQLNKYKSNSKNIDKDLVKMIKEGNLDIIIVVEKLLTGFDSPKTRALYLIKGMEKHNLLQAIARVNRKYDNKNNGLIIDYIGIMRKLKESLNSYSIESNSNEYNAIVYSYDEIFKQLLIDYKNLNKQFESDVISLNKKLKNNKKKRSEFYELYRDCMKSIDILDKLIIDDSKKELRVLEIKKDLIDKFTVVKQIIKGNNDQLSQLNDLSLFWLLNENIETEGDVKRILSDLPINDPEFFQSLKNDNKEVVVAVTLAAISDYIELNKDKNPKGYETLSQKLKETLEKFNKGLITNNELQNIIHEYISKLDDKFDDIPKNFIMDKTKKTIYENIKDKLKELQLNEKEIENIINDISHKVSKFKNKNINETSVKRIQFENELTEDLVKKYDSNNNLNLTVENLEEISKTVSKIGILFSKN